MCSARKDPSLLFNGSFTAFAGLKLLRARERFAALQGLHPQRGFELVVRRRQEHCGDAQADHKGDAAGHLPEIGTRAPSRMPLLGTTVCCDGNASRRRI